MEGLKTFDREISQQITETILNLKNENKNTKIDEIKNRIKSASDNTRIFLYWTFAGLTIVFDELVAAQQSNVRDKKDDKETKDKRQINQQARKNGVLTPAGISVDEKKGDKPEVRTLRLTPNSMVTLFKNMLDKLKNKEVSNAYVLEWNEGATLVYASLKDTILKLVTTMDRQLNNLMMYRELQSQMAGNILRMMKFYMSARFCYCYEHGDDFPAYDVYWLRTQERDTFITSLLRPIDESENYPKLTPDAITEQDIFSLCDDEFTGKILNAYNSEGDFSVISDVLEPLHKHRMRVDNRFGVFISVPRSVRSTFSSNQDGGVYIVRSKDSSKKEFRRKSVVSQFQ